MEYAKLTSEKRISNTAEQKVKEHNERQDFLQPTDLAIIIWNLGLDMYSGTIYYYDI
jgi:hypothetical protein